MVTPRDRNPAVSGLVPRMATDADNSRRSRAGFKAEKRGQPEPVWCENRNGWPEFKPYTYKGNRRMTEDERAGRA